MAHFALLVHRSGALVRPLAHVRHFFWFLAFSCSSESSWRIALVAGFVGFWVSSTFFALLVRRSGALLPTWCLLAFSGRCHGAKACWYSGGATAERSVRPELSCLDCVGASLCWLLVSVLETSVARHLQLRTFLRGRSEHLSRSFASQLVPMFLCLLGV